MTSNRDKGFVTKMYIGLTAAEAIRFEPNEPMLVLAPTSFWIHFCSLGWPTSPRVALASECPINGKVPRNNGVKFFAAASLRISIIGLVLPVCLKKALCCFSIIRIGLMNGAERIDAPVAATMPTSPSPTINEIPKRIPNLGTRLNPTPINLGITPDKDAPMGAARNTALASSDAIFGSTTFPFKSFAYCCTNCLYAVTGLSMTV
mmetsp:Transcript_24825/g.28604  ORF Transcript_24825/g.28604 Transcript_24825/m.28604 type:complete len:205 (-) Transcript_24825:232-846(-)